MNDRVRGIHLFSNVSGHSCSLSQRRSTLYFMHHMKATFSHSVVSYYWASTPMMHIWLFPEFRILRYRVIWIATIEIHISTLRSHLAMNHYKCWRCFPVPCFQVLLLRRQRVLQIVACVSAKDGTTTDGDVGFRSHQGLQDQGTLRHQYN
jgi:hypothetical protein